MPITLKCRDISGSVSFSAETIEGLPAPMRRYVIENGLLTVEANDAIARHDIAALLAMPDVMFRLLTSAEQDALAAQAQAAISIVESVPPAKGKTKSENGG